ncbi:MAG: hypothetical protein HKN20_17405 [Gemmatimonadetes bacterium]|nr:hypothetical protein [Gemmatimonadota bacterium]
MAKLTRKIGLSLAADICWPICYEAIMDRLKLNVDTGRDQIDFQVERVTIEPFPIKPMPKYDLVIDRLTHWYHVSREWIKKAIIMDDIYVFNNPWSIQSMEKHTSYSAMTQLGFPVPETWMIPPKEYEPSPDLEPTLTRYARMFNLPDIGKALGYPLYMKPYSGGGWVGVTRIENDDDFQKAYDESGKRVMNAQASVEPYDKFVRCVGLGPQVRFVTYDPSAPLHNRYTMEDDLSEADREILRDMTLVINAFFGWDFNSCESLERDGIWHPIDFANPCPDSQVTSLHYHFPWLISANIRWSVYCAATKKKMRPNLDWKPFFAVHKKYDTFHERLAGYVEIAHKRFETEKFEAFCEKHLSHLDEVTHEFFGSEDARKAVKAKVEAMYPEHEVDEFTDLFWERIQKWRSEEGAAR